MMAGAVSHSMAGRDKPPTTFDGVAALNLYNFHVFAPLRGVAVKAVFSGNAACHYAALDADGGLYMWGRNEKGQLGTGNTANVYSPTKAVGLPPIASVALGRTHSLAVTTGGELYGTGNGSSGQLGLGSGKEVTKWTKVTHVPAGAKFVAAAAGGDFSIALDAEGRVYTCGSQQDGQCGTGKTGEYIVSAGRVAHAEVTHFAPIGGGLAGVKVTQVAAGVSHGAALDETGQVYTWGTGGFGRLGHGSPKEELVPRAIRVFEPARMRVKSIACGQSCTYAVLQAGDLLYMAGITKKSGEANMVPKHVADLAGWSIRSVACGSTHTAVAAEKSLVTWGPSPTSGELGYGEATKSSTKAKLVDDLEGCHVLQTAAGLATTLILVDVTSATKEGETARGRLEGGAWKVHVPPPEPAAGAGAAAATGGASSVSGAKRGKAGGAAAEGPAGKKARKN